MRRTFLLAFAAFFLLGTAWALALPVNGTYDEKQHIVRAYAVWTGQWLPHERLLDGTSAFLAPASLLPVNPDCTYKPKPARPATCLRFTDDRNVDYTGSGAARYSPVYYALVGLPIVRSPDQTGIIWARVLSALASALLLAVAVTIAAQLGNRLLIAAVALTATPLAIDLDGAINPNGLEISAGVLLFVALLAVLRAAAPLRSRLVLASVGVAAALLLTLRDLGPVLFLLVLAAALVVAAPGRLRETIRDRAARRWVGIPAAAGVAFMIFWVSVASRSTDVPGTGDLFTPGQIASYIVHGRAEFWIRQIVAQFNYGETTVSPVLIGLWYLLVAALVGPALRFGDRRLRLAIVGVAASCVVLLVALEFYFAPRVGLFAHSRYIMPLGVGVLLLAPFAERFVQRSPAWLPIVLVGVTVPIHVFVLGFVMARFERGLGSGRNPFAGGWAPAAGAVLPVLSCCVGAVLLAVIVTRSSVQGTPVHSTVNTLSN